MPGGRYRMIYEAPIEPPAEDDPNPIHTYTQRCTDLLELSPVIHRDSPLPAAIRPSRVEASFSVTNGVPFSTK